MSIRAGGGTVKPAQKLRGIMGKVLQYDPLVTFKITFHFGRNETNQRFVSLYVLWCAMRAGFVCFVARKSPMLVARASRNRKNQADHKRNEKQNSYVA